MFSFRRRLYTEHGPSYILAHRLLLDPLAERLHSAFRKCVRAALNRAPIRRPSLALGIAALQGQISQKTARLAEVRRGALGCDEAVWIHTAPTLHGDPRLSPITGSLFLNRSNYRLEGGTEKTEQFRSTTTPPGPEPDGPAHTYAPGPPWDRRAQPRSPGYCLREATPPAQILAGTRHCGP